MKPTIEKEIQYVVFAPARPLSQSRWNYYQATDGTVMRTISGPAFGESDPDDMHVGGVVPDAMGWARLLHDGKPHFDDCLEAQEIYSTLCNVRLHATLGNMFSARVCLEGIIKDCQTWIGLIQEAEKAGQ